MIESGSLVPGVDPDSFGLPDGTAFRLEMPELALQPYVADYHVYDSDAVRHPSAREYILPSWPALRICLADNRMDLQLGSNSYHPLPVAALYGTTTRAMLATPHGGVTIGISLTPLGWARLFTRPANEVRKSVIPLSEAMDPARVDQLVGMLRASNRSTEVKPLLDQFLNSAMLPVHRDEPSIRQMISLIDDPGTVDLTQSADRIGISAKQLSRLSNRHFGYPPKRLLMRARFMRSFMPMFCGQRRCDFSMIDEGYVDVPHFLRDARHFLGMTPARFMAQPTPYLDAVLRAMRVVRRAARRSGLSVDNQIAA